MALNENGLEVCDGCGTEWNLGEPNRYAENGLHCPKCGRSVFATAGEKFAENMVGIKPQYSFVLFTRGVLVGVILMVLLMVILR